MQAAVLLLLASAVVGIDQASKMLAVSGLSTGAVTWLGPIRLRYLLNRKAYRGIGRFSLWLMAFWLFEIGALSALVEFDSHMKATAPIALGVALGGASSNLLDRFWRGGVVDFIDLRFWPVFNLADLAIVFGILGGVMSL
jgi:signal peptidase II